MRTVTLFFVFILVSILYIQCNAATCETTGIFTWSNTSSASNWSCGRRPQGGDIIVVKHPIIISTVLTITGSPVRIEIKFGGSITFLGPSDRLEVPENSGIIMELGGTIIGVNPSNQIRIGLGPADWQCGAGFICPLLGPTWIGNPTALPISLLSFDVQAEKASVRLEWITATEENNHYFTIERSANGAQFDAIGTVAGAGNSYVILNYTFTDANPLPGSSYYRLKQTDFDQTISYSKVVSVKYQENPGIEVYPNPSESGIFEIYFFKSGNYEVFTSNSIGNILKQENFSFPADNPHKVLIDLSAFPRGIYFVYVYSANQPYTFRLVY